LRHIRLIAVAPLALALLIAGCGSSSSSSSNSGKSSSSSAASQSSSSAASASSSTSSAASSSTAAPPAALITTKHDSKLGTILAYGPKKLTVYLFEADKGPASSCSGACAQVWPPVIGKPTSAGGAMASDLATIKRSDGKTQVTYKGHPLYLFIKDKDDGDAYGEGINGFGAAWYVLRPSGAKVDQS
jgi:predicted lipoprotein with Yx(FWY)xxD motif